MRAREAISIFKTIYDEFRDEGVYDIEICRLINLATQDWMREAMHNILNKRSMYQAPIGGFENTQWDSNDWSTLISEFEGRTTETGYLMDTVISEKFPSSRYYDSKGLVSNEKCKIAQILSVERWSGTRFRSVTWDRHNEVAKNRRNPFRKPNDEYPRYLRLRGRINIEPGGSRIIKGTVLRYPVNMWYQSEEVVDGVIAQDPELPRMVMITIIYRALILAGVNMRENQLMQMMEMQEAK